ncbi:molybdate ABC transporter substrate-binding protein [Paenibacillus sp. y28]|uniref:molybdate ABC transporter substrate-binding protein n=1 Tax=Paenibacillus sp. y28 TaxID=3129110 RepID=UPI003018F264
MRLIMRFSVILSAVAVMLLMIGCGAKPESGTSGQTAAPKASPEAPAAAVELTVSAAASLTDALKEIQKLYEAEHKGVKLNFNFGASGTLQQQIEQGAPADLFLSAAAKNMKTLVDKQLVEAGSQKTVLLNELVVVLPADGKVPVAALADVTKPEVKHVAIGIPESVPAGQYAQEALKNAKLWDGLQERLVQAKDVRAVLQYVETGNADAGFVYKTDALTSSKVKIAFAVDAGMYKPVEYPFGIVKGTQHSTEAQQFYDYLQTPDAMKVFAKYGFSATK